ncbi:MAG: hypothetical protein ACR2IK_15680 [Chloroflexota bacterium]
MVVLAVAGGLRARVPAREWLFPACVVLGTLAALGGVPGRPAMMSAEQSAGNVSRSGRSLDSKTLTHALPNTTCWSSSF